MKLDDIYLKNVCEPATFNKPKQNLKLAQQLFQLMLKEQGIGLAANQAGINYRVFVMLINDIPYHCFNPEILQSDGELVSFNEGCLSFKNERCEIIRPNKILVKYYSAHGVETIKELQGLASRCFQHELDHLNGITMHDRK